MTTIAPNNSIHHPGHHIPGIDGLRAIAVLSVILFHLKPELLPGGFIGVDIFFVISGYVISRSLSKADTTSLSNFILGFYKRRVLRIFPALIVCLIITSIFAKLFIPSGFWLSQYNNWTGLSAFFGISNFYLVSGIDGYFSERTAFNPYVHTWSLAVEEQFYIIFPFVYFLWLRLRNSGNKHHRIAFFILPSIALISLLWSTHETTASHEQAFYLLPSRFWELTAGAMLYQFNSYRPRHFNKYHHWTVLLGIASLSIGLGIANETNFPFPWALAPVFGTVLLVAGATSKNNKDSFFFRLLAGEGMSYIGRISYSLYLWHWPIFVLFRWTIGLDTLPLWLSALSLTFALSSISYHFIETTFRGNIFFTEQASFKVVGFGIIAIISSFYLVKQLFFANHLRNLALSTTNNECLWKPNNLECNQEPISKHNGHNLFIIGDSHAGAYELMGHIAGNRVGANVYVKSIAGCPMAKLIEHDSSNPACRVFRDQ